MTLFLREYFFAVKITAAIIMYMMIAGATNVYVDTYDPTCNSLHPEQRLDLNSTSILASAYWPIYWSLHLGQLIAGYESTCADDPKGLE